MSSRGDMDLLEALTSSLDIGQVLRSTYPLLLKRVGADHGALGISLSGRPEDYRWIAHELPGAFFDAYAEMAPHDFVRRAVSRRPGVVLRDQDMLSRDELKVNRMYRHAQDVDAGLEQVMAVMLHDADGWQSGLSLYRTKPRPFSAGEQQELQGLTPAIVNVVRNCCSSAGRIDLCDALDALLGDRHLAIVLVMSPGGKVEQTAAATRLIEKWFDPHERREGRLPEPLRAVLAAQEGVPPVLRAPPPWTRSRDEETLKVSFQLWWGQAGQPKWRLKLQVVPHAIAVPAEWQRKLTAREREVTSKVLLGWDNRLISDDLCLRMQTVKSHVEHIFDKTGLSSRAALIVRAVELTRIE